MYIYYYCLFNPTFMCDTAAVNELLGTYIFHPLVLCYRLFTNNLYICL